MTEIISTFTGLTKNSKITIFNETKQEQERIIIGDFILIFNAGLYNYQILGYDIQTLTYAFYPVSDVFLVERQKPVTVLTNTSFDMSLAIAKNKIITSINKDNYSTKKTNKISPVDSILVFNKNLEFSLETNWLKNEDVILEDLYEITIESGTCLIINDIVVTI